ncbi:hypothetical protein [Mycolicibacterium vaccae]|uniref:hypothetical protein n=1 Tax=Mycolicibacterium vaccae TaxID=1810 RepID=UPI003D075934
MPLSLRELKEWVPEIADLAQSARDAAANHTASADFYRSLVAISTWEGSGADAARSAMKTTANEHGAAADAIGNAAERMDLLHEDAEILADRIKGILDDAAAQPPVMIDESTNQVIPPDVSHLTEEYGAQVAAKVANLQARIASALAEGTRIDSELAGAIIAASETAEPLVRNATSLQDLLLAGDTERRNTHKLSGSPGTPADLERALDQIAGEPGHVPASQGPGRATSDIGRAPLSAEPAMIDQFKELARQTMARDGVPPELIEQRLDAIVAAAQKPLPASKPAGSGSTPSPSFSDGFADGWFNTEEGIKDLIGANGWDDLRSAWTDMAKGGWQRVTNPMDTIAEDVEHLTKYPGHYLGEVAGGTAITAPGALLGGEAALAARGAGTAIPDDVIDTPNMAGALDNHTLSALGGTDLHVPPQFDPSLPSDALSDLLNLPNTGPYELPDPSLLSTPRDGAFFWSGRSVEGAGIGPMAAGGNGAADLIAHGSNATVLEALMEKNGIQPPKWSPTDVHAENWWSAVSQMYAANASGEVHAVVGSNLRPGNVWESFELPRLIENPNVTRIIVIDPDTGIETIIFQR